MDINNAQKNIGNTLRRGELQRTEKKKKYEDDVLKHVSILRTKHIQHIKSTLRMLSNTSQNFVFESLWIYEIKVSTLAHASKNYQMM